MSKLLPAQCQAGIVRSGGVIVPGATILSKGTGSSSGAVILEGETATYMTSNATDLEQTLTKVNELIGKLVEALNAISGSMAGPATAPPPGLPPIIIQINAIASELNLLKGNLK